MCNTDTYGFHFSSILWHVRSGLFMLAAFSLLLALCSRESACLWVAMFLAHLFIFDKTASRRVKIAGLVACFLVVGLYAFLRQLPEQRVTTIATATGWPAPMRATLMARALGDYTRLMIWPSNLHMERTVFDPQSLQNSASWRQQIGVEYLSLLGLIVAVALIVAAARKGPARGVRIFGAAWFLLTYLPTSNLFQLNATVAEHWLYLPSVGFLIFSAGCCLEMPVRMGRFAAAIACLACLGLGGRTFIRSTDWLTAET